MDTEDLYRQCEIARVRGQLSVQDLWLRYLALGGNHDAFEIDGYLQGLLQLEAHQEHVLAVALNERLEEVLRAALIPLPATATHEADGAALRVVIDELLGGGASRPRPCNRID